jgi:hypothetical protein
VKWIMPLVVLAAAVWAPAAAANFATVDIECDQSAQKIVVTFHYIDFHNPLVVHETIQIDGATVHDADSTPTDKSYSFPVDTESHHVFAETKWNIGRPFEKGATAEKDIQCGEAEQPKQPKQPEQPEQPEQPKQPKQPTHVGGKTPPSGGTLKEQAGGSTAGELPFTGAPLAVIALLGAGMVGVGGYLRRRSSRR